MSAASNASNAGHTSKPSDFLPVRVVDSDYSRKWGLSGSERYRMAVLAARITLTPDGDDRSTPTVIPRGLIKWYCEGPCHGVDRKRIFFLEINADAALGPGIIEIIADCNEGDVNISAWVNARMFPAAGGIKRWATNFCRRIAQALALLRSALSKCFPCMRRLKKDDDKTTVHLEKTHAEAEKHDEPRIVIEYKSERPLSLDELEQPHSLKGYPAQRKGSMTRLRTSVSKAWSTLSRTNNLTVEAPVSATSNYSISTYRSYQDLEDIFTIDDHDDVPPVEDIRCPSSNRSSGLRYVQRMFSQASAEANEEEDIEVESLADEHDLEELNVADVVSDADSFAVSRRSWYEHKDTSAEFDSETAVAVAFDKSDNSVIVVDENDIFKVSSSRVPSSSSLAKPEDSSSPGSSDDFEVLPREEAEAVAVAKADDLGVIRYVDAHSKSLDNLNEVHVVGAARAKFDPKLKEKELK